MPRLSNKWKVVIAFGIGVVVTTALSPFAGNSAATVTEAMLDARSNGVIEAQQKEIERLRAMIQKMSKESGIQVTEQELKGSGTCTTHSDCPSIASVCVQNTCQNLQDPLCECGHNGKYVICVSENGNGNEARTVSCGDGTCSDTPSPHCGK